LEEESRQRAAALGKRYHRVMLVLPEQMEEYIT